MTEPTTGEHGSDGADLAAAARDFGTEQLETAKTRLAEGAERVASAVERTADELDGDGGDALSGAGHSVASLMRQLAGGLRERDVEGFARELAGLARNNPGVFLAGSVALGFGIARFFKASAQGSTGAHHASFRAGGWQASSEQSLGERDYDGDESLDLSANSLRRKQRADNDPASARPQNPAVDTPRQAGSAESPEGADEAKGGVPGQTERAQSDTSRSKGRGKHKVKPQLGGES